MLEWFFKRPYKPLSGGRVTPEPKAAPTKPVAPAPSSDAKAPPQANKPPPPPALDDQAWQERLRAATGDDAALLALARDRAPLAVKLAAVEALQDEAMLKQAERAFRDHDRRVHRVVKQRLQARAAQQQAQQRALALMAEAQGLVDDPLLAVNRLVALDRAWQALDASLLPPEQTEQFRALLTELGQAARERAEAQQAARRWTEAAQPALQHLQALGTQAATGACEGSVLAETLATCQDLVAQAPAPAADSATARALQSAVAQTALLLDRLQALQDLMQAPPHRPPEAAAAVSASDDTPSEPVQPEAEPEAAAAPTVEPTPQPDAASADESAAAPAEPMAEAVESAAEPTTVPPAEPAATQPEPVAMAPLPPVEPESAPPTPPAPVLEARPWELWEPLPQAAWQKAVEQRLAGWLAAQQSERQAAAAAQRAAAAPRRKEPTPRPERERERDLPAGPELAALLDSIEAALDAGTLGEAHRLLVAFDTLLHDRPPPMALRARVDQVQSRYAELKGWQHWAGGRARDDLTQQAEALAAPAAEGGEAAGVKLSIQQRIDLINDMRARWKELDRLGGATSRALWQRFDTALKTAYEPVAAHLATVREAREQNLAARQQLLDTFEALALPGDETSSTQNPPSAGSGADEGGAGPLAPWRAVAEALDLFQSEWRKRGPVEHTVPHKARAALIARHAAAMQRVLEPLQRVRDQARAMRQDLIARAQTLAAQASSEGPARDTVAQVRELQMHWQAQARALPLPRNLESELWAAFRGATDAIFQARDAAFQAREAEFQSHAVERAALIERLAALSVDTPPPDIRRTLDQCIQQWQRCGPAPRAQAGELETQFRNRVDAAQDLLNHYEQQLWMAQCDALEAKLALCETREHPATDAQADDLRAQWDALRAVPPRWEQALRQRAGLEAASADSASEDADTLLLQLEAAWGLPTPPQHEAARRLLKLQAMKAAMETRRPSGGSADPDEQMAQLLRLSTLQPEQRERLQGLLQGLRRRRPRVG